MAFKLAEAYVQFSQRGMSSVHRATQSVTGSLRSAVGVGSRFATMLGGLGLGLGFGAAIKTIGSFEEQMSKVEAITQATDSEVEKLTATARQLGADTAFSASEAAAGMEFLARAGFKTDQIISAMPATLDLALSGALDLGAAADIASNALTGFGLAASESDRVADVLALTAASANTDVLQLGAGLKFVAPIAAGLGVSIETTSAAIGALSDAGLQGEMAGTGLRKILAGLADPSDELKKKMGGLTLEADGFNAVLQKIAESGISTTEGMREFGERGGPAIGVLVNSVGKINTLSESLDNAGGTAKRLAGTMSDNLVGASKQSVSAFQELTLIAGDSGLLDASRSAVESMTEIFRSDGAKEFAADIGVVTLETIDNIGTMAEKVWEAMDSMGLAWNSAGSDISETWETFKFFSRNFGDIWDIAVELTSIGIQNLISRVSTYGTNVMEIGTWMVENWRNIFLDMNAAQTTVLMNIGANLKEFLVQIKSWLSGDGFNFEVTGLLDGFERTTPELPPLTQPVIVEGSEKLDSLLERVSAAEMDHLEEKKEVAKKKAEIEAELKKQEVEETEKAEKKKQNEVSKTEKKKRDEDEKTKDLLGSADAVFNETRDAIASAHAEDQEAKKKAAKEAEEGKADLEKFELPEADADVPEAKENQPADTPRTKAEQKSAARSEIKGKLEDLANEREFVRSSSTDRSKVREELERIRAEDRELRRQLREPLERPDEPIFAKEDSPQNPIDRLAKASPSFAGKATIRNEQYLETRSTFENPNVPSGPPQGMPAGIDKAELQKVEEHLKSSVSVQESIVEAVDGVSAAIVKASKSGNGNTWT